MNFRKLITYLTMGTAAAMPLAVAQNPTILQGSYISNVFGNSNFIKNPNAQTNIADVTVSNATVTRSTTTPLVATSEFLVTTSTATGSATWSTRTFDGGMKGQNCEARFSYRGFSVGSTTAQILQGANVVAQLTLTASTDPRIASINFPCGDLSAATTFRLQQATASLTGTNEIGGIYVGLATNMANVAQAEEVGSVYIAPAGSCQWDRTGAGSNSFGNFSADPDCPTPIVTGAADTSAGKIPGAKFNNLKPGKYLFMVSYPVFKIGATNDYVATRMVDGTGNTSAAYMNYAPLSDVWMPATAIMQVEYTTVTSPTIQMQGKTETTTNTIRIYNDGANPGGFRLTAYRFPSSSELVVTPERQNVFGGVVYTNQNQSLFATSAEPTAFSPYTNATWNQPTLLKGKAAVTTTNSGNDLGFSIPNLPVGNYKLDVTGLLNASVGGGTTTGTSTICNFKLVETTTSTDVARQTHQDQQYGAAVGNEVRNYVNAFTGVFTNTSVATRNFRIEAQKHFDTTTGNIGNCQAFSAISGGNNSNISIIMTPLDQPSNSALYVQGPVKAAETGAVLPAGYIGETVSTSSATSGSFATGVTTKNVATITLQPGTWLLWGNLRFEAVTTYNFNKLSISASPTGVDDQNAIQPQAAVSGAYNSNANLTRIVRITAPNTIYYLNTETWLPSGVGNYTQLGFTATRIGSN